MQKTAIATARVVSWTRPLPSIAQIEFLSSDNPWNALTSPKLRIRWKNNLAKRSKTDKSEPSDLKAFILCADRVRGP
jgi:hypothetical protein